MKKALFSSLLALSLAGCGITAKVDARNEYQESAARYKNCLAANPSDPRQCEALRLAMETDERKYTDFSAATSGGAGSVVVQSSGGLVGAAARSR